MNIQYVFLGVRRTKEPRLGAVYHIILRFITGDEIRNYFTLICITS